MHELSTTVQPAGDATVLRAETAMTQETEEEQPFHFGVSSSFHN
jgi:hypothetical protein